MHSIIPTRINLIGRFVDGDSFCTRCGVEVEKAEHIF